MNTETFPVIKTISEIYNLILHLEYKQKQKSTITTFLRNILTDETKHIYKTWRNSYKEFVSIVSDILNNENKFRDFYLKNIFTILLYDNSRSYEFDSYDENIYNIFFKVITEHDSEEKQINVAISNDTRNYLITLSKEEHYDFYIYVINKFKIDDNLEQKQKDELRQILQYGISLTPTTERNINLPFTISKVFNAMNLLNKTLQTINELTNFSNKTSLASYYRSN